MVKNDMTLRDYLAAQAMAALIAARASLPDDDIAAFSYASAIGLGAEIGEFVTSNTGQRRELTWAGSVAIDAYELADAMLRERDQT